GRAAGAVRRARTVGTVSRTAEVMATPLLALVVPCYNEAARLDANAFVRFLVTHPGVRLVLVDDGSDDGTAAVLERIHAAAPEAVTTIRLDGNRGKGEAVRA